MFYAVKIRLGLDVSKRMLPGSSLAQEVEERPVKKVLGILFFNNGVWISLIFACPEALHRMPKFHLISWSKTLRKPRVSAKFLQQEIMWNFGILRSE